MAYISNAGTLVDQVSELLRHENIDTMIYAWLSMTYDDLSQRISLPQFTTYKTLTIAANAQRSALSTGTAMIGDIVCGVFVSDSTSVLTIPAYKSFTEYAQLGQTNVAEGAFPQGTYPVIWAILASSTSPGQYYVYVLPEMNNTTYVTLFYTNRASQQIGLATDFYDIPYWCEAALVWGAVALGAKSLNPQLYPVAKGEYEDHVRNLINMSASQPDRHLVRKMIGGPAPNSNRRHPIPQWPLTIPAP